MSGKGGMHGEVGGGACVAGEAATKVGGTHLNGMHSCSAKGLLWKHIVSKIKSTLDPIPTPLKIYLEYQTKCIKSYEI